MGVAKLQGDKNASFCSDMSGREVTGRWISIPVFHGTLLPMDFWTPPRFLIFPVGQPHPEPSPKPKPLQVTFSLLERVDLRSQKEGTLGKKIAWGRAGWTGQQKKKKRMRKKKVDYDKKSLRIHFRNFEALLTTLNLRERRKLLRNYQRKNRTSAAKRDEFFE